MQNRESAAIRRKGEDRSVASCPTRVGRAIEGAANQDQTVRVRAVDAVCKSVENSEPSAIEIDIENRTGVGCAAIEINSGTSCCPKRGR